MTRTAFLKVAIAFPAVEALSRACINPAGCSSRMSLSVGSCIRAFVVSTWRCDAMRDGDVPLAALVDI